MTVAGLSLENSNWEWQKTFVNRPRGASAIEWQLTRAVVTDSYKCEFYWKEMWDNWRQHLRWIKETRELQIWFKWANEKFMTWKRQRESFTLTQFSLLPVWRAAVDVRFVFASWNHITEIYFFCRFLNRILLAFNLIINGWSKLDLFIVDSSTTFNIHYIVLVYECLMLRTAVLIWKN